MNKLCVLLYILLLPELDENTSFIGCGLNYLFEVVNMCVLVQMFSRLLVGIAIWSSEFHFIFLNLVQCFNLQTKEYNNGTEVDV